MIGVAGAVAELSWRGEWIDEDYWFEPTMMSDTDWNMTQCVAGKPDDNCIEAIRAVAAVLERGASLWHDLLRTARDLIIASQPLFHARATDK
jgi:hypothetical protein